jgi:hypothetical protein
VAEYGGSYRLSWHDGDERDDRDEFEVVEVLDWHKSLSEWRRPDDAQTTLGKLLLEDGEVSPPGALDGMEPGEEHFREATGNEGASFDRTYSRATLVIWPSNRPLAVINMAGLEATLPYPEDLIAKWQAARRKGDFSIDGKPRSSRATCFRVGLRLDGTNVQGRPRRGGCFSCRRASARQNWSKACSSG